jgi:tetratricopeptide (TPR) repeat protein
LARVQQADDDAAAEATLRKAQRVLEADGSTQQQTYLSVLSDLGLIYSSRGQPRELYRISQLIGATQDRSGRGGTSARVVSRQNAATALNAMGEPRAALAEREIINERLQAIEGQLPTRIATNYANVLLRMAQPEPALRALQGTVERAQQSGNPADVIVALLTTSQAYTELQRWDEAEAALSQVAPMLAGPNTSRNSRTSLEMQRARLALGRGDLPAAHLHRDQALELAGFGTEKREAVLSRVLSLAARVALAEKSAVDLERFARAALALNEPNARGPDTSADVGEALLRLAQARGLQGNGAETRSLLERAVRCLANGMGESHPLTVEARDLLAQR